MCPCALLFPFVFVSAYIETLFSTDRYKFTSMEPKMTLAFESIVCAFAVHTLTLVQIVDGCSIVYFST